MPEAQFNLGLMLQTGQGTQSQKGDDMGETWGDRSEILKERSVYAGWEFGCLSLWSN